MIVAGFGLRAAATAESLRDALALTGQAERITALATPVDKSDLPAFAEFRAALNLPLLPVPPEALCGAQTATQSEVVRAHRQTGSVAEASALAAAGPQARLLRTRVISTDRMASCAIAVALQGETE